ncbi:scavenger receptor class B, member [Chamberlinius hualienensis]
MRLLAPLPACLCIVIGVLISIIGGILFHYMPSIINDLISKKLTLDPDSELTSIWTETPIPIYTQFYLFNYTNADEFVNNLGSKDVKPVVQQLGPYTYRQKRIRESLQWHDEDDAVEYRQRKIFYFVPELSSGSEDDLIIFPNIPLNTIVQMAPPTEKPALKAAIQMTNSTLFIQQTVGHLLFEGYRDDLVDLIQILTGEEILPGAMFGLFYKKNNTDDGVYHVSRGNKKPEMLGNILSWNNASKLSYWTGDKCNTLRGTDASIFPTKISRTEKLYLFSSELCRSLYLGYQKDVEYQGVQGFRFEVELELLGDYNMNPDNECFCYPNSSYCAGAGVLSLSSCKGGAPVFMSSPHFLMADFKFVEAVEGLNPVLYEHNTFVEIEPLSGTLLRAARKIQTNVLFKPIPGFPVIENLPDILLPLLWLNESAELTSEMVDKLKTKLFSPIKIGSTVPLVIIAIGCVTVFIGVIMSLILNFKLKRL